MNEVAKHTLDGAAVITAATTFLGVLPDIAALLSIIWLGLRIANEYHTWKTRRR